MYKKIILSSVVCLCLSNLNAKDILTPQDILQTATSNISVVSTNQLQEILSKKPNTQIIDVRSRAEILADGGFIKANRVTNISRDKLEFLIQEEVKKDETFIVYCDNGQRSALATYKLKQMGYKNVLHYAGSFNQWVKENQEISSLDKYPSSMLYGKVEKIAKGVYTSIGHTNPGTYENVGHNNNLGFVIGDEGVLVWNAGGTYLLAKALHEEILKITNKPIKYVVLENSQGHAAAGASYWKDLGATIVAQEIAKVELEEKIKNGYIKRIKRRYKDKALGTNKLILPDITFKDNYTMDLGNKKVVAKYFGYAHEHSDISIWLPKEKILFAGDLAFNQRLLPIFTITRIPLWLEAWDKLAALNATIVVPGHGDTTDMATVTKYTKDYLTDLRTGIANIIEDDGDMTDAYNMDMSKYEHLDTYKELGKQNISRVFKQMEFE
jgi:rhodanese-related sulfurtransferase/glyoxylase-like metal-dependent hydrolase (beta-lactamase superfamily II)